MAMLALVMYLEECELSNSVMIIVRSTQMSYTAKFLSNITKDFNHNYIN